MYLYTVESSLIQKYEKCFNKKNFYIFINVSTKKENKNVRINIRLTNYERVIFNNVCKDKNSTISKEIRKYINNEIRNNEK